MYVIAHRQCRSSVPMQSAQLPQVAEFKYVGSTLQSDGGMSTEINKRTQCGWNNWEEDVRRPMRQESTTTREGKYTQDGRSASYAVRDGDSASHVMKLEVTEMKMCRWACGHKRPCEKRKHQGETEGREYRREVQESATQVVWPRKEARRRLRRKKDSGDGSTRETKARKIEAEMDGLCQPRHDSHRNYERRGP